MSKIISLLIAGGCFPVQENIPFPRLYHQLLRERMFNENDVEADINIIRYEKLESCFDQISDAIKKNKTEILLFHLRIEPLFKFIKFYYENLNSKMTLTASLNISLLGIHNLILHRSTMKSENYGERLSQRKKSFLHSLLRETNYALGVISGNMRYIFRIYLKLVYDIYNLCRENNIQLIITSPASRPVSAFEDFISNRLFKYFEKTYSDGITIINALGKKDENGEFLFCEDKIRVNETGHKRFAKLIYNHIAVNRYSKVSVNKYVAL